MSDLGLFSAPAQWQAKGFIEGLTGKIPVWDGNNQEVGYRTSYNDYTVYFNANYKGQSPLYSLTFGQDTIQITPKASNSAQNVAAGQAQMTPIVPTGTATTGSTAIVPVTTASGVVVPQPVSGIAQWLMQNRLTIVVSAGAVAMLWLLFGGRK